MPTIKRIEIRNFRSIHHLIIDNDLDKLNVFVGNNDIGKSNILRALNLFFNRQTDIGKSLDFWEDFNKNIKRVSGKGQYIKIVLDINLKYEKNKFVRWTKQWNNQGIITINNKDVFTNNGVPDKFISGSRAPNWLDRIIFRYVPAIKSPLYFQHLFEELHDVLNSTYSKQFHENTKSLIENIQQITQEITKDLKNSLAMENKISLPTDLKVFFGSLDFSLSENGRRFNLAGRGDGIKVRHIPIILYFLANKAKINKRGALDIQTIWGFEEPENNLEMSHAFEVANKFLDYSKNIQLFLTTHSPAFYSLKDKGKNTTCYFVGRDNDKSTIVSNVKNSQIDIDEKMGILAYITPFVDQKNEELKVEHEEREKLEHKIKTLTPESKCIVFTEDSSGDHEMLKAILIANGFNMDETQILSYDGKDNLKNAIYTSQWLIKEKYKKVKHVIFHRDRDIDGEKIEEFLTPKLKPNYSLFITKGYDLESYFYSKGHIKEIYPELDISLIEKTILDSIEETKDKSIRKLADGLFQMHCDYKSISREKSPSKLQKEATKHFENDKMKYAYGKKVMGVLIGKLQHKISGRPFKIIKPSSILEIEELQTIKQKIWD